MKLLLHTQNCTWKKKKWEIQKTQGGSALKEWGERESLLKGTESGSETTEVSGRRKARISWSTERCVPRKGQDRQPHVGQRDRARFALGLVGKAWRDLRVEQITSHHSLHALRSYFHSHLKKKGKKNNLLAFLAGLCFIPVYVFHITNIGFYKSPNLQKTVAISFYWLQIKAL